VVPIGSLVVENGFTDTVEQGQHFLDLPESLLRLGIAEKTEIRLTAPDAFDRLQGEGWGFGDVALGVKQQLGPVDGFDISVVATLSLPTGGKVNSSHGYDPSVQAPWSRALSSNWTAAGMFSVYWPTVGHHRNVTGESTFLIDRQITKPWDGFVEYVGDFDEMGGPRHLLHVGTALKTAVNQQVDLHFGIGLSRAAVDHFIGVGYSFRVPILNIKKLRTGCLAC